MIHALTLFACDAQSRAPEILRVIAAFYAAFLALGTVALVLLGRLRQLALFLAGLVVEAFGLFSLLVPIFT